MGAAEAAMIALDSSFLIANYNTKDVFHSPAVRAMDQLRSGTWGRAILLEYVFTETIGILKRKASTAKAVEIGHRLRNSRESDFVLGSEVFLDAWNQFQGDFSSPLSFVDHAVAVVARQKAGGKVLTFDKAFRQLPGITILPE